LFFHSLTLFIFAPIALKNAINSHLFALIDKLEEAGINVNIKGNIIITKPEKRWKAVDIVTLPYPGFPTDLQAQMMSFLSLADGISVITEKVFPERRAAFFTPAFPIAIVATGTPVGI